MVEIRFLAQIDEDECIGCGECEQVCPTEAIKIVDEKAVVDEKRCLACPNCSGMCPQDAITKVTRSKPMVLGIPKEEVDNADQNAIRELCLKANLHPMQWLCLCTATRVREGALAVLRGCKTPVEVALMTGIRSGCTAYCLQLTMRLLKAHGVKLNPPKGHGWYDATQSIWEVSDEFIKKHPGYFLEEDKKVFRKF